jgi:hypothetical protein
MFQIPLDELLFPFFIPMLGFMCVIKKVRKKTKSGAKPTAALFTTKTLTL